MKTSKLKKIPDYVNHFFEYNIHYKTRTLYYGANSSVPVSETETMTVNDWSAEQIIKGLFLLDQINNNQITIIWNSHGGDWDAGIAIYEYIRTLKSPVKMICYSRCRSMGSVIMQACKTRVLSKYTRFMIHYGTDSSEEKHAKDLEKYVDEGKKLNRMMEDIYLKRIKEKHPRFTKKELSEKMKYDWYMSADEALKLGLIDKVI